LLVLLSLSSPSRQMWQQMWQPHCHCPIKFDSYHPFTSWLRLPSMAAWHTFPRGFILVFAFVLYLSIMVALKCCNECPQKYEATNLRALRLHQKHCEAAQHQHTRSMQTRKTGLAKDRRQLASLHRRHKAADTEVRVFLPLVNELNWHLKRRMCHLLAQVLVTPTWILMSIKEMPSTL